MKKTFILFAVAAALTWNCRAATHEVVIECVAPDAELVRGEHGSAIVIADGEYATGLSTPGAPALSANLFTRVRIFFTLHRFPTRQKSRSGARARSWISTSLPRERADLRWTEAGKRGRLPLPR